MKLNLSLPGLLLTVTLIGATSLYAQTKNNRLATMETPSILTLQPADKKMMARCNQVMDKKKEMLTHQKAMDDKLDGLVREMDAASSNEKIIATGTVVKELIDQRKELRNLQGVWQMTLTQHMMEHMQGGKNSIAGCPVMAGE